jgi:putative lipoprotein
MHGLLLVFTLHLGPNQAAGDRWFGPDKAKHFFMAAFVESGAFSGLRLTGMHRTPALNGAIGVAAGVSLGKEVYDRYSGGDASFKDLMWDGIGMAAAGVLLHQTKP